ncbi:MAG: amidohydrolase family protein [Acidobacteria bacterium]|nr:amidohydrolase family protein [Acidobacteriota bacterium]
MAVATALILATVLWGPSLEIVRGQSSEVVLFEGARLIAGDGSAPIENAAFLVRDGKIDQVGRQGALQLPPGASRVDLTGKTVMPMLINLHGHIGYLKGVTVDPKHFTREQVLDELRRHQYYGIGVVQVLGTDRHDLELRIRDEQRSGALKDPTLAVLFSAGRGIVAPNDNGPNGGPPFSVDVMREAASEAEGRRHVRELAAEKVDAVKMWVDDRNGRFPKLKPEVYRAIIDEAHKLNLKVLVHATLLEDSKALVKAGVDGLAHPVRGGPIDDEFVQLMKQHDVFQCTTVGMGGKTAWIDDPALAESVAPAVRAAMKPQGAGPTEAQSAAYGNLLRTMKLLSDAGVRIALCGDEGTSAQGQPGFREHLELEALAEAGLTPLEVIRAATQTPAEILGLHELGTLTPGKRADFIVLDANPLDRIANTRNIAAIYKAGRAIDRAALRAAWTGSPSPSH